MDVENGELLGTLSIDYEIFARKLLYTMSVTCWTKVAKVTCGDDVQYYHTLAVGDFIWLQFMVHHYVEPLSVFELLALYEEIIFINVHEKESSPSLIISKKKIHSHSSQKSKTKSAHHPRNAQSDVQNDVLSIINDCWISEAESHLKQERAPSFMNDLENLQTNVVKEILATQGSKLRSDLSIDPLLDEFIVAELIERYPQKKCFFTIFGQSFFADDLIISQLQNSNGMIYQGYALASIENLMTQYQKTILHPFSVTIHKLDNIPIDNLMKQGYYRIYIEYTIPGFPITRTPSRPLAKTIYFQNKYVFIHAKRPEVDVCPILHTKIIVIYIQGIKITSVETNVRKRRQIKYSIRERIHLKIIPLFVEEKCIKTDIIAVLRHKPDFTWAEPLFFRMDLQCHSPNHTTHGCLMKCGALEEYILTSSCTSLDVEYSCWKKWCHLYSRSADQCRIVKAFIISKRQKIVERLLALVVEHNTNVLGYNVAIQCNKSYDENRSKAEKYCIYQSTFNVVTGFAINNFSETFVYLEGPYVGPMRLLCERHLLFNANEVNVSLGRHTAHTKRNYEDFEKFGILMITLKVSMGEILSYRNKKKAQFKVHLEIIEKLNKLFKTVYIHKMEDLNLLPDARDLLVVNQTYGVPSVWNLHPETDIEHNKIC